MRRVLKSLATLMFMTGLVYPYIHLGLRPHRYCPYHHAFEPVDPDQENGPTHNPGPGAPNHKKCPFAQLIGAVAVTTVPVVAPLTVLPMVRQRTFADRTRVFYQKHHILRLAPKHSPPAMSSLT